MVASAPPPHPPSPLHAQTKAAARQRRCPPLSLAALYGHKADLSAVLLRCLQWPVCVRVARDAGEAAATSRH